MKTTKKPKNYYRIVHTWINKHYGKASICENLECNRISTVFEYCLRKNMQHERNRDNYIELCRSCHRHYDMTDTLKAKMSKHLAGKFNKNLNLGPLAKMKKVILIEDNKVFDSGKELATYLGCDKSSVYHVLSGKRSQKDNIKGTCRRY